MNHSDGRSTAETPARHQRDHPRTPTHQTLEQPLQDGGSSIATSSCPSRPPTEPTRSAPSTFKQHLTLRSVSLERIRIDRCLHEALTNGADPLHLATLFGLHPTTAVRYAISARRILDDTLTQGPKQNGG